MKKAPCYFNLLLYNHKGLLSYCSSFAMNCLIIFFCWFFYFFPCIFSYLLMESFHSHKNGFVHNMYGNFFPVVIYLFTLMTSLLPCRVLKFDIVVFSNFFFVELIWILQYASKGPLYSHVIFKISMHIFFQYFDYFNF